jgi:hypothetical protein
MNPTQYDRLTGSFLVAFSNPSQRCYGLGQHLEPAVTSIPDLGFIRGGTPEFDRVVGMIKDATENLAKCLKPKPSTGSPKSSRLVRS